MAITVNLKGVKTELEAVPPGNYQCVVSSAQYTMSKRSNQPMIAVQYRIEEPEEHQGRKLFDNISLQTQALFKLKRWLLALGWAAEDVDKEITLEPEELIGLPIIAVVINEVRDGELRSKVSGYASIDDIGSAVGYDDDGDDDSDVEFTFD